MRSLLVKIYKLLLDRFGFLNWWPAETPFEVVVGTILTQNVAWSNVERSISALKREGLLNLDALLNAPPQKVKRLISPSGYYNVKYNRLIMLLNFIKNELGGDIRMLRDIGITEARRRLLLVKGVGKETADSILLYAADMPVFVVDAYTRRSFYRIGVLKDRDMDYDDIQRIFMENLKRDVRLYKDYHAQIVELCKNYCKKRPLCENCPLERLCKKRIY